MISLFDGQVTDLLPYNLKDSPEVNAFSLALRDVTRLLNKQTQLIYVYSKIETMPDNILDLLAKELRTQYYSDSLEIDIKRSLVRSTLIWYMTAGTPAAVEELVTAVFGEGEVTEWFEYGGEPYYFRIKTNAELDEDMMSYFSNMIQRVKNTRSHIEAIEISRKVKGIVYAGVGSLSRYKPAAVIDNYFISGK